MVLFAGSGMALSDLGPRRPGLAGNALAQNGSTLSLSVLAFACVF